MSIRHATTIDKANIVALLKASLGETSSPKTIDYWNWKHVNNPFGESPVLLSSEDDALIGARAFMRWQWQLGQKTWSAVRAVDTATHPLHQGKGIFKKLTLQLVEESTAAGEDFVFNTPNDQSRPGYLKMGWVAAGKIQVGVALAPVINLQQPYSGSPIIDAVALDALCGQWNAWLSTQQKIFTPKSAAYLQWRYTINPVQQYMVYADDNCFIASYARQRGRIKELRLSEFIFQPRQKQLSAQQKKIIGAMAKAAGAHIITYSPVAQSMQRTAFRKLLTIGPLLTLRKLAIAENDWTFIQQMANWQIMLGDMELF